MNNRKEIAFFINSNGANSYLFDYLELVRPEESVEIVAIALEEKLPDYAKFPNPNRKSRLEDILKNATKNELDKFVKTAKEKGFTVRDSTILTGHFPSVVQEWLAENNPSLLVKQSLPCDGNFGYASKGDVKLARHTRAPLLLLHSKINPISPVLLGLPHLNEDSTNEPFCERLLLHAIQWCQTLNTSLHIVHAWSMFGENVLRSRIPKEELKEELDKIESKTAKRVNSFVEKIVGDHSIDYRIELHKGNPTRILLGEIDVVQPSLVVLGSAANEGIKGVLLGNTAESIVRRKETSVLVVH